MANKCVNLKFTGVCTYFVWTGLQTQTDLYIFFSIKHLIIFHFFVFLSFICTVNYHYVNKFHNCRPTGRTLSIDFDYAVNFIQNIGKSNENLLIALTSKLDFFCAPRDWSRIFDIILSFNTYTRYRNLQKSDKIIYLFEVRPVVAQSLAVNATSCGCDRHLRE